MLVKNFQATEGGLNFFGDVSGRFSNFSFHFSVFIQSLFGVISVCRGATLTKYDSDCATILF